MRQSNQLRLAIQKSGRLSEPCLQLLAQCGINFSRGKDQLICQASNYALELLFVRDDDIPELIESGACDAGIVGGNVLTERQLAAAKSGRTYPLTIRQKLGFGTCRLSLAAPRDSDLTDLASFNGKTIATGYPATLENFLSENGLSAKIVTMHGALEVAPRLEIANGICDLVSTGSTLTANGLREVTTLLRSEALLVARDDLGPPAEELLARLERRIMGVLQARDSKYIMLHCDESALASIVAAIPGAESPTVLPLPQMPGKVAVHAVCEENVFWETAEQLKKLGASAILVLPIEKMLD